jgi:hypothetical protein
MDENRLQAYLNLIQELLSRPDEEQQILDANPDLIDTGLMQIMLVTAADLTGESQLEQANRLIKIVSLGLDEKELGGVAISQPQYVDLDADGESSGLNMDLDADGESSGLNMDLDADGESLSLNVDLDADGESSGLFLEIFDHLTGAIGHSPTPPDEPTNSGQGTIPNGIPTNPTNSETDNLP